MQELVEYIVKGIVDLPDQVAVGVVETPLTVVYEVGVDESDLGKVIGRRGRVAEALRVVVRAARSEDTRRHTVEILS
jgi:uncharacterized protein